MTITSSDPQHFIPPDTRARSYVEANPSIPAIYLQLGGGADQMVTLVLDWGHNTKAGALAQLAEWVAAVEALPDDTHAGQGVLPTAGFVQPMESPYSTTSSPTITAPMTTESPLCVSADVGSYRSMQILCTKPAEHEGEHENGEYTWPAPVWRTLTFGDLRAGDKIKVDEDGDEETVRAVAIGVATVSWIRTDRSCGYCHNEDPVLVRHPRPEVGQ